MDHLYQLLCIPKPPALSFKDLNNGNYNQFLEKVNILVNIALVFDVETNIL